MDHVLTDHVSWAPKQDIAMLLMERQQNKSEYSFCLRIVESTNNFGSLLMGRYNDCNLATDWKKCIHCMGHIAGFVVPKI